MPTRKPKTPTDVASLARGYTELCVRKLGGIVSQSEDRQAVIAAARVLLERGWGKAPETVNVTGKLEHGLGSDAMSTLLGRIDAISGRLPPVIDGTADPDPSSVH